MSLRDLVPTLKGSRAPVRRAGDDPFYTLQREMNRLFDDFFGGGLTPWERAPAALDTFAPRVNVAESEKEVTISAELPGMDEKDVTVELDEGALTLKGERKTENEHKGDSWYRREYAYGSFARTIPLPCRVQEEKARARFKKGVLTVTLPKRADEGAARKAITIEAD
jgi:HSP20 family protein